MSETVTLALISNIGIIVVAYMNYRTNRKVDQVKVAVKEVHKDVNGKIEKLLTISGDAREAKGKLAGQTEITDIQAEHNAANIEAAKAKGHLEGRAEMKDEQEKNGK